MRKYLPALMLAALVMAIPSEAFAQRSLRNSVEITPYAGFRFANTLQVDVDLPVVGTITEDVRLKNGFSWGFIVDVPVTDYISLEAFYARRSQDIEVEGLEGKQILGSGSASYIHGGALINLNPYSRGAQWFLAGTLGVGIFSADVEDSETQSKFSFGFGAGVKIPVSDSIKIRTEFRGFSTKTDLTTLGWICGWYTCGLVQGNQYFWEGELRAGVEFGF